MNVQSSPAALAAPTAPSAADREVRLTSTLVVVALLVGAVLQVWVPPGGLTLVAGAGLAGVVAVALTLAAPGRVRTTMAGFRFVATLLFVLAVFAMLGTLVLQGKPAAFYVDKYGTLGTFIVALRLDDIFHGLPFALVMALFGASIVASAMLRWPVKAKNSGYWLCHVGLLTSLLGASASATLAIRGRIDLHAGGEHATQVRVTKGGAATGEMAALGFDLHLDRFDLVNYEPEHRIGYYEQVRVRDARGVEREQWRLKASFDPDTAKHRLPSGDSFRLKAIYPDFRPVAKAVPSERGSPALEVSVGGTTQALAPGEAIQTPDGRVAVLFGWERPPAPQGVETAVLVSGAERKVVVHRADGAAEVPLAEGGALLGGVVRFGKLHERAARSTEYASASDEWRNPAAVIEVQQDGLPKEQLMMVASPSAFFLSPTRALVFEKRDKEVKAYVSHVTAYEDGAATVKRKITVNDPLTHAGWTLYQVNYNPQDPTYSGLEAVYDPGVNWVFLGFALICLGVVVMFYVEPRLKQKKAAAKA